MENKKIFGLIGLATKAGKLLFGSDSVEMAIKRKKVFLVIIAQDASARTKNRYKKICNEFNIPIIILANISDLSKTIGKKNKAVLGIQEKNIANQIIKIINGGEIIG